MKDLSRKMGMAEEKEEKKEEEKEGNIHSPLFASARALELLERTYLQGDSSVCSPYHNAPSRLLSC